MVAQTDGIVIHVAEDINDILALGDRTGHASLEEVATTNEGNTSCVGGSDGIAQASQTGIAVDGTVHIILIEHHNTLLLLAHGIQIAEQSHLTTHGLTRRKFAVDPEVALVKVGLLTRPATISPSRIAVFQNDLCITAVMTGRPGLGAVEGCLSRMALRGTIITTRSIAVGDMTLTKTRHLNNVAGITS